MGEGVGRVWRFWDTEEMGAVGEDEGDGGGFGKESLGRGLEDVTGEGKRKSEVEWLWEGEAVEAEEGGEEWFVRNNGGIWHEGL